MSSTGLKWCGGCQANVKPALFNKRPRCGTSLTSGNQNPTIGLEDLEIESETRPIPGVSDRELIQTPMSGRLVLNPKVDDEGIVPLCPDCGEEIRRFEAPNEAVEFRCDCEELRYFEFPEASS